MICDQQQSIQIHRIKLELMSAVSESNFLSLSPVDAGEFQRPRVPGSVMLEGRQGSNASG